MAQAFSARCRCRTDAAPEKDEPAEVPDRDYDYSQACSLDCIELRTDRRQLLERVYAIMHAKDPSLKDGKKSHFVMKPPQVVRMGTKKTGFANFAEISKLYVPAAQWNAR